MCYIFDPLLLEVLEVHKGYLLESAGAVTAFQQGTIDNQTGKIIGIRNATRNGDSVSGTGVLLSVTFAVKAAAETQVRRTAGEAEPMTHRRIGRNGIELAEAMYRSAQINAPISLPR